MKVLLETERLILRQFSEADADHLYELDNDPEVMRYLNGGIPASRDLIKNDILPLFLKYDEASPWLGFWATVEKATGVFVGWFSFRVSDNDADKVGLGYRLTKASWGKGYATEGAQALIDKGFSEWGVQRVTAITYEDNIGSRRVMEKVGMTLVRTFRMTLEEMAGNGTFVSDETAVWDGDDVEYTLKKADWERQNFSKK